MKERRQYKRFTIPLPVRLNAMNTGRKEVLDLEARDISYSGTFIPTLTSFPKATRLFWISPFQVTILKNLRT